MAFFNIAKDAAANVEATGGDYISKSGIYPITIQFVSVDVNASGARSLNFNVKYKDNEATLWGLKLDNNDGSANFMAPIFNRLCNVAELDGLTDPEQAEYTVGKDKTPKDFLVLPDFADFECAVRVQEEYSKWNGDIKKRLNIKNFYRNDGASASEVISGENIGTQLGKDKAYADNITYKDCTADEVAAWKAAKSGGGASAASAKPAVQKPAANIFG